MKRGMGFNIVEDASKENVAVIDMCKLYVIYFKDDMILKTRYRNTL